MSRTISYDVFKFEELEPDVQEKVVERWRDQTYADGDFFWMDETVDSMKELFKNIDGVRLVDYTVEYDYYYRSTARIEYSNYEVKELSGPRAQAWLENNLLYGLRETRPFSYRVSRHAFDGNKPRVYHKYGQYKSCPFTGYCADDDLLYKLIDDINKGVTVHDALMNVIYNTGKLCREEIEGQLSDEYIREHISINDYEFTKEGRMV
jgi:hypothetical protein